MTILEAWNTQGSIKGVVKLTGFSNDKVIKELSTMGIIINNTHREIIEHYNNGLSVEEIADRLKLSTKVIGRYLPRTRPLYNVNPSENALRIKECRRRKEYAESLE